MKAHALACGPGQCVFYANGQKVPDYEMDPGWTDYRKYAEEDVMSAFEKTLRQKNSLACGKISLPYVIETAGQYGMNDLIAEFITREDHPSCYAFVREGETTLGEQSAQPLS